MMSLQFGKSYGWILYVYVLTSPFIQSKKPHQSAGKFPCGMLRPWASRLLLLILLRSLPQSRKFSMLSFMTQACKLRKPSRRLEKPSSKLKRPWVQTERAFLLKCVDDGLGLPWRKSLKSSVLWDAGPIRASFWLR